MESRVRLTFVVLLPLVEGFLGLAESVLLDVAPPKKLESEAWPLASGVDCADAVFLGGMAKQDG